MEGERRLETGIPARLSSAEGRRFGLTVGLAFCALGGLLYWRGFPTGSIVAASLGILLLIAGMLAPAHLGPVFRAWMKLALLISKVTTPLFMAVVYFLVLTPIGLIMRVFAHRPLVSAGKGGTHWVTRGESARRSDLERQF